MSSATCPPILVINLRRSAGRREHMSRQLAALGLDARFVDAVDGGALTDEAVRHAAGAKALDVQPLLQRRLTFTEIACALSHLSCYQWIVDQDVPMAFVFEDDIDVHHDFVTIARQIDRFPAGWELALFAHHSSRHGPDAGADTCYRGALVAGRYRVARVAEFPMGAMGYLVTRAGAIKLLQFARPLRMPADWLTGYSPTGGVRLYGVTPPCITLHAVGDIDSTITGRTHGAAAPPRLRAWAGRRWLWLRKMGVYPSAYSKRL